MNKRDLAKFESILSIERERITKEINSLESSNNSGNRANGSSYGIHMAETGSEEEELEKNLVFLSREGDTLTMIDEALKKIGAGKYGVCERCEGQIPKARLVAKPFAKLCIQCRMDEERHGNESEYI